MLGGALPALFAMPSRQMFLMVPPNPRLLHEFEMGKRYDRVGPNDRSPDVCFPAMAQVYGNGHFVAPVYAVRDDEGRPDHRVGKPV